MVRGAVVGAPGSILHVTNGDVAARAIQAAGVPGAVLPWRDVLHEGPVPAGRSPGDLRRTRARFIASVGWAPFDDVLRDLEHRDDTLAGCSRHDEVVLWFEHDLYDQLQLLQILDALAGSSLGGTLLSLVCVEEYLGPATPDRLRQLFEGRQKVSSAQLALGRRGWSAFRSSDPTALTSLLHADTRALPFLAGALTRHLQQFPSTRTGLSRSEEQALAALASGARSLGDAFARSQADEERRFLGDATFALYLDALSRGRIALVTLANGDPIVAPRAPGDARPFWARAAVVTASGHAVLTGAEDHVRLNGIDRWLGGVHLEGEEAAWRWDAAEHRLCSAPGGRSRRETWG
jgi:Domain of unknown function (DUF1835)